MQTEKLKIERKVQTKDWSFRVNSSILGMVVVDSWLVYKGTRDTQEPNMMQHEFYENLPRNLSTTTSMAFHLQMGSHCLIPLHKSHRDAGYGLRRLKRSGKQQMEHALISLTNITAMYARRTRPLMLVQNVSILIAKKYHCVTRAKGAIASTNISKSITRKIYSHPA